MTKVTTFWNTALETINKAELQKLQLTRLKEIVDSALKTSFYNKQFKLLGINSASDIKSLADLNKFSFTVKNDLRDSYPFGLLSIPKDDVVRLHSSSGTTGTPTVIYYSAEDLSAWTELIARCITATGATRGDVFQNMISYGLFSGGLGLHYGAERVGMMVIPSATGNTERQLKFLKDFQTTVIHATPSYLLHVYSKIKECGYSLQDFNLKKAFAGAEPYSENTRQKIEKLYNIDVYNSYGLSEMNGPGVAFECEYKCGMHIWEDAYIVEIIDPETGKILPDGETGEVVLTNLIRKATPLLRYRTRDLAYLYTDTCRCGRTHRRLSRIVGRTDDMLIINGVNVFPSQIEEVIMKMPEIGNNYQIYIEKEGALDKLIIKVEMSDKLFQDDIVEYNKVKERLQDRVRSSITIMPRIEFHEQGSLPVFEGKAKRVGDNRPKL